MDHQLKRLLNLVRRTGDRLVVTDPNGEDTYVLMGLEAYEKLSDHVSPPDEEPWEPPRLNNDFIDDFDNFNGKYSEETDDFDPDWEIPDEFLTEEARVRKNRPRSTAEADNNSPLDHNVTEKTDSFFKPNESSWQTPKDIWETMKPAGSSSETWNSSKFTPEEQKVVEEKFGSSINDGSDYDVKLTNESVPDQENTQKIQENKPEEPGEEQFYLEPIE